MSIAFAIFSVTFASIQAAITIKTIKIRAKIRYSLMSSFVKICSFLPAKYLTISYGILNPAASAMIMAEISKML